MAKEKKMAMPEVKALQIRKAIKIIILCKSN
jgi:hypothetical protein